MSIDGNEIIASVIAFFIVFAVREARAWFAEFRKQNEAEGYLIEELVTVAVKFAEQTGKGKPGKAKFNEALTYSQELINARGLDVDLKYLTGLIEAKVNDYYGKQPTPPTWTTGGGQS